MMKSVKILIVQHLRPVLSCSGPNLVQLDLGPYLVQLDMGPYLVQLDLGPKLVQLVLGWPISTGCIKKMVHSDFSLKSVPGVRFCFFRGGLEPEFCA